MTPGSLFQSHASEYYRVSTAGPLHYPTPEIGGPVLGRNTVWDKYVDETRHGEQISDGRVLRTGVFVKSLVRGGTGAEISWSSTSTSSARSISCKRHKIIPARGREARRPGRRQLARHALQPENLGTTATLSPEPWRNTQDPTFAHNAAVRVPYRLEESGKLGFRGSL